MPARRRPARTAARPVTARALLKAVARLQQSRDLDGATVIGLLCEVVAAHPPSARRAVARIEALLDAAGVR
jgi:hypothetical protein